MCSHGGWRGESLGNILRTKDLKFLEWGVPCGNLREDSAREEDACSISVCDSQRAPVMGTYSGAFSDSVGTLLATILLPGADLLLARPTSRQSQTESGQQPSLCSPSTCALHITSILCRLTFSAASPRKSRQAHDTIRTGTLHTHVGCERGYAPCGRLLHCRHEAAFLISSRG